MTDTIARVTAEMDQAAAKLDFETARRLRDQLVQIRGGASVAEAESSSTEALERQKSGAMGLGTNRARMTPPEGWTKPARPDLMTTGKRGRR